MSGNCNRGSTLPPALFDARHPSLRIVSIFEVRVVTINRLHVTRTVVRIAQVRAFSRLDFTYSTTLIVEDFRGTPIKLLEP